MTNGGSKTHGTVQKPKEQGKTQEKAEKKDK